MLSAVAITPAAFAQPDPDSVRSALEKVSTCSNFVRFDDENLYFGFGNYKRGVEEPRSPIPGEVRFVSIAQPEASSAIPTADGAIDLIRDGNSLFALTYSGIEELDLAAKKSLGVVPTFARGGARAYKEHPQAFARYGDKVIIAHGRLGVSFFDLKKKRITNQFRLIERQSPMESMATGVVVVGRYAYVSMDNFTLVREGKPAFRGIVVIDMESERVVSELEGMDPGAAPWPLTAVPSS